MASKVEASFVANLPKLEPSHKAAVACALEATICQCLAGVLDSAAKAISEHPERPVAMLLAWRDSYAATAKAKLAAIDASGATGQGEAEG